METEEPYEYEVDLRDYIKVIWREKWIIVGIFLLAVGLAAGYSFTRPATYKTETTLAVTPNVSKRLLNGTGVSVGELDPDTYREIAKSNDLLKDVTKEVNDTFAEKRTSPSALKNKISVEIKTEERDFPLVKATVTGNHPQKIKKIANTWAEHFVQRINSFVSKEATRIFQSLSEQFQTIQEELEAAEEENLKYKKELENLKYELDISRRKRGNYFSQLEDKSSQISGLKTKIERLQKQLDGEPKYLELERSVSNQAIWSFLREGLSKEELKKLPGLNVKDQEKNNLYFSIKNDLYRAEVKLNTLKKEIPELEKRVEGLKTKIKEKQSRIQELELALGKSERKTWSLRRSYDKFSDKLEEARIIREGEGATIRVIEEAIAPEKAQPTNTKQNVAVAGVLGLFIGILAAFFKNYMEGYEE